MTAPCGVPIVAGIQSAIVGRELNLRTPVIFGDLAERLGGDAVNAIEEGAAHQEGAFRASCGRRYRHCHRRGNMTGAGRALAMVRIFRDWITSSFAGEAFLPYRIPELSCFLLAEAKQ